MCFPQTKYQVGVKKKQRRPDFRTAGLLEVVILYQREAKVNKMGKLLSPARKEARRAEQGQDQGAGRARGSDRGRS